MAQLRSFKSNDLPVKNWQFGKSGEVFLERELIWDVQS